MDFWYYEGVRKSAAELEEAQRQLKAVREVSEWKSKRMHEQHDRIQELIAENDRLALAIDEAIDLCDVGQGVAQARLLQTKDHSTLTENESRFLDFHYANHNR